MDLAAAVGVGPVDYDCGLAGVAQSEVLGEVVLHAVVAVAAVDLGELAVVVGDHRDLGADGGAVGGLAVALEAKLNPVILGAHLVFKEANMGFVAAVVAGQLLTVVLCAGNVGDSADTKDWISGLITSIKHLHRQDCRLVVCADDRIATPRLYRALDRQNRL